MMLVGGHAGPEELARFRIEAEAVARLQHPNIVQIHEVGEAGGHPYCALEFVEARACSLAPGSFTPAERPGELARGELDLNGTAFWSLGLQGALHHRAGRYREAVSLLRKSRDDKSNPPDGVAGTRMWMALTYQKLNQPEQSRREFEQVEKWLAQFPGGIPPDAERTRLGLHLHNWLEVHVLRLEVAPLLRPGPVKDK